MDGRGAKQPLHTQRTFGLNQLTQFITFKLFGIDTFQILHSALCTLHSARAECKELVSGSYYCGIADNRSAVIAKLLVPDCKANVLCV